MSTNNNCWKTKISLACAYTNNYARLTGFQTVDNSCFSNF